MILEVEQGGEEQSHPGGLGIARQAGNPRTTWTDVTLVSIRVIGLVGNKGGGVLWVERDVFELCEFENL